MRNLKCNKCGKIVSNLVPDNTIVRGGIECPECAELDKSEEDNKKLRELLWLRHGCNIGMLYSDDGEMQCDNCIIDFKRHSVKEIENRLINK